MIEAIHPQSRSAQEISQLMAPGSEDSLVVSLVLPMEPRGAETRKNPIVFKNALSEAEERLRARREDSGSLEKALHQLRELDDPDSEFWSHQRKGLLMTIPESGDPKAYHLPFGVEEGVHVSDRPYLIPLLRLCGSQVYHVLVLDLNELRLFRADRWSMERIELTDVPESLEEAMKFDDPEKSLQQRSVSASNAPGPGGGDVAYHGHGITGDEATVKRIVRFFEKVAKELPRHFDDRERPLVLCGPETEIARYRQVNHYPHLADGEIAVNPSSLSEEELEETVRGWIAGEDRKMRARRIEDLEEHLGKKKGSSDLEEISQAIGAARVSRLHLREGARCYGSRDEQTGSLNISETRKPGDRELIADLVAGAAATGSEIYFHSANDPLPGGCSLAATFRY